MRPWKKVIGSKSCHFRFIRIIWIIWPCRWWDDVMVLIFMIHNIHLADVVWYILKNAANPRDHYDSDKWSASLNNYTGSESWLLQSPAVSAPAPLKTAPLLPLGANHVWQCYKCSETHCLKFATLAPPSHSLIYAKNILNERYKVVQLAVDSWQCPEFVKIYG